MASNNCIFYLCMVLIVSTISEASNLTCLKCDSVASPTACKYIDRCGPHEVCSIDAFVTSIGSVLFNLGCKDSRFCSRKREVIEQSDDTAGNTGICNECCTGDLCNAAGCGHTGYDASLGPVCYSCDSQIGANMCHVIEQCGRDQVCEIHAIDMHGSSEDWYKSQCMHTSVCKSEQIATHGGQTSTCNTCCNTTVCNDRIPSVCTGSQTKPSHSTPPTPTTHRPSLTLIGNTNLCPLQPYGHKGILAQHGDSCYALSRYYVSWKHAERICRQESGHLFHISNEEEQRFIQSILAAHYRHPVWMGLNDINRDEHFQWISGQPVTYTNWKAGRKDDFTTHSYEDCVVFIPQLNGVWDDIHCGIDNTSLEEVGQRHAFVCQYDTTNSSTHNAVTHPVTHPITHQPPATTTAHPASSSIYGDPHSCPSNVLDYKLHHNNLVYGHNDRCYVMSTTPYTWFSSNFFCQHQFGGRLVEINDAIEQRKIEHFLRHYHVTDPIWTGLHGSAGHWMWSSGVSAQYVNWDIHANHDQNITMCAYMLPNVNGVWRASTCSLHNEYHHSTDVSRQFLCEIGKDSVSRTGYSALNSDNGNGQDMSSFSGSGSSSSSSSSSSCSGGDCSRHIVG